MYIVPQRAPAASAAATPRSALPPGAWADDATASSVAPVNIRTAPPSTPSQRADPASRSSLKSSVPQRMPSRLLAFHSGNAMASPDRKSTRLNSSHEWISYAVFCLKKKNEEWKYGTYVDHSK